MTTPTRTTDYIVRDNIQTMLILCHETQGDLAKTMQLSQPAVSRRLNGGGHITLRNLDLIARHFGITVADLVTADFPASPRYTEMRRRRAERARALSGYAEDAVR